MATNGIERPFSIHYAKLRVFSDLFSLVHPVYNSIIQHFFDHRAQV